MICERCNVNYRPGVEATTRLEYRHEGDHEHWANSEALYCDRCAQALRDYCNLPRISMYIVSEAPIPSRERNKSC